MSVSTIEFLFEWHSRDTAGTRADFVDDVSVAAITGWGGEGAREVLTKHVATLRAIEAGDSGESVGYTEQPNAIVL